MPEKPPKRVLPSFDGRSFATPPRVVVFGAGITGLTVAHELIERGFDVQVVEPKTNHEAEHEIEVGGIAANQAAAVKADLEILHPHLFDRRQADYLWEVGKDDIDDVDVKTLTPQGERPEESEWRELLLLQKLRALPMRPSHPAARFNKVFTFYDPEGRAPQDEILELTDYLRTCHGNRDVRKAFLALKDAHGSTNQHKIESFAAQFAIAITDRAIQLARDIELSDRGAGDGARIAGALHPITVRREILLLELWGHAGPDVPGETARELGLLRSRFVRRLLFEPVSRSGESLVQTRLVEQRGHLVRALTKIFHGGYDFDAFVREAMGHVVARSAGNGRPLGDRLRQRERSNRVDVRVIEVPLPGEHGYRYFPGYYRHLFDTMRRTPILDEHGEETLETAFDRLVEPPPVSIALSSKHKKHVIPRQHTGIEQLRRSLSFLLKDLQLTSTDLQRFVFRLLVFLTSGRKRRESYEQQSWIEFLDGASGEHDPRYKPKHISERAAALVGGTLRSLLAMDASEIDAHSYALNSAQLMLDTRDRGAGLDMTLIGPSSQTWLRPWKRYLVAQGVEFFCGELIGLVESRKNELEPLAVWNNHPRLEKIGLVDPYQRRIRIEELLSEQLNGGEFQLKRDEPSFHPRPENPDHHYFGWMPNDGRPVDVRDLRAPDFYVLALPFEQAARIAWKAKKDGRSLLADWEELARFDDTSIDREPAHGFDKAQYDEADPVGGTLRDHRLGRPEEWKRYPLRDLSGIQFFFSNNTRLASGHVVYPDSPWGLSGISQLSHWRDRRSRREGFLGHFSVDIGDFYREHRARKGQRFYIEHCDLDPAEAYEILEKPRTAWRSPRWEIPLRTWEQILRGMDAETASSILQPHYYHLDQGILFRSAMDGTGDMDVPASNLTPFLINLPGQFPLRPGRTPMDLSDEEEARMGNAIGPCVSNGRWVLAGTYMASHTRIMTMEASNESARHAVNAILRRIRAIEDENVYNSQNRLLGSYCEIFDPYDHEVDDFAPLKELDDALEAEELPHVLEILGFERILRYAHARQAAGEKTLDAYRTRIEDDWNLLRRVVGSFAPSPAPRAVVDLLRGRLPGGEKTIEEVLMAANPDLGRALRAVLDLLFP